MVNRINQGMFVFVARKDVKFEKPYNFPGNTNFKKLLLDLFNIKLNCSF